MKARFVSLGVLVPSVILAQGFPPLPPDIASKLPPGFFTLPTVPSTAPTTAPPPTPGSYTYPPAVKGPMPGTPVPGPQPGIAEWTVLVYAVADNDLEGPILDDLDEMERVGSTKGVNIVMEIDRWRPNPLSPAASRDDKTNGDWDTARRYFVTRDDGTTVIHSKLLAELGEIDMSHPKELKDFIAWGVKTFPAKKYALIMEDHGSGWKGGFVDELAPPEPKPIMMTLGELAKGLEEGRKAAGIGKFDLLATDACLMGTVEVADAIAPHVKVWATSEELQPGPGFEYTVALSALAANPKMDGVALGKSFVNAMRVAYGPGSQQHDPSVTSALLDMSKVPAIRAAVDAFATRLKADLESNKIALGMAGEVVDQFGPRTDAISGPKEGFADMVQVAAVVRETTSKPDVKAAAIALIAATDAARLDKYNGEDRTFARGLSIWLPPTEEIKKALPHYRSTPFGKSSPWSDLLAAYGDAFKGSVAPTISGITIGKNPGNPFGGERPISATITGEVRKVVVQISQNVLSNVVPVESMAATDPALYKKLPEGPGVTAWKKGSNTISAKWNPMYATLQGKGGIEFPLSVNRVRLDAMSFDTEVGLRLIGGPEEGVMLRFSMPAGAAGYAGSKLLTGYFIDVVQGQTFYTPFVPSKLPAAKVAFEPRYTVVDSTGKKSIVKLPLQVKWDKIEDLKVLQRPMLPGTYTVTVIAEDFAGHQSVAKSTTTIP